MENPMKAKSTLVLTAFCLTVQLLAATSPIASSLIHLEKAKSEVSFLAVGTPSSIKIRGKAEDPKETLKGTFTWAGKTISGTATVNLDKLNTGIELRDKHMKEKYLETQKFPQSELTLTSLTLPDSATGEKFEVSQVPFQGKLLLHGITKPVAGVVNIKKVGSVADLAFDFKFPLNDFGIETPSFMGIKVTDDVQVTVSLNTSLASE